MTSIEHHQHEIEEMIGEQLAFLTIEKGFSKPVHPSIGSFHYYSDHVKISAEVHWGAFNIDVTKPGVIDERSRRNSWNLLGLLQRRLLIQDERIAHLIGIRLMRGSLLQASPGEIISTLILQIAEFHDVLVDYIDLILQQPPDILFPDALEFLPMRAVREPIQQHAITQFAFLSQKGFMETPVEERKGMLTYLTWLNQSLGVQMGLDYRDADIDIRLILLHHAESMFGQKRKKHHRTRLTIAKSLPWTNLVSPLHLPIEQLTIHPQLPQAYYWSSECDYAFALAYIDAYRDSLFQRIDMILAQPLENVFGKPE